MSAFLHHPLLWLLGTLGLGGTVLVACILVFGWPIVLAFFNTRLGRIGLAIAAVLGLFVGVYAKGRSAGKADQKAAQEDEDADFVRQLNENDQADAQLSDADLDRRLRDNGNTGPR